MRAEIQRTTGASRVEQEPLDLETNMLTITQYAYKSLKAQLLVEPVKSKLYKAHFIHHCPEIGAATGAKPAKEAERLMWPANFTDLTDLQTIIVFILSFLL